MTHDTSLANLIWKISQQFNLAFRYENLNAMLFACSQRMERINIQYSHLRYLHVSLLLRITIIIIMSTKCLSLYVYCYRPNCELWGGLIQYNALNSHTEQILVVILINILMLSTFPMFSESKYSKTQCSKAAFMVISSDTISIFCWL